MTKSNWRTMLKWKAVILAVAVGLSVGVAGWFSHAAEADHEDYLFYLDCGNTEVFEHANAITSVRLYAEGHGPSDVKLKGTLHLDHDTTSNADFSINVGDDGFINNTTLFSSGSSFRMSDTLSFYSLDPDLLIIDDDLSEHDETFTLRFEAVSITRNKTEQEIVDELAELREENPDTTEEDIDPRITVPAATDDVVADINDPSRDNRCDYTILSSDPIITDMLSLWTVSSSDDNEHEGSTGTNLMEGVCDGNTYHFKVIWDLPPDSPMLTADEWQADIKDSWGTFENGEIIMDISLQEYAVDRDDYGVATLELPVLRGSARGDGEGTSGFGVRVRPMIDGEWKPYSALSYLYCTNEVGGL